MIAAEHIVKMQDSKFRVWPIGDCHLTLRSFDEARFKRYIKTIAADPAGVAIVMGDVSDARSRDHKYFAPGMISPRFAIEDIDILEDKAADYAAELLAPLGDKLIGALRGNHHQAGFTHSLRRSYRHATDGVSFVDLGDRAMIRIKAFGNRDKAENTYIVFAQHRTSGGRKPGAQLNQQIDNISSFDADLYLYAHSHKPMPYPGRRVVMPRRGALRPYAKDLLLITANAWVDGVTFGANSYSDEMGLPTTSDSVWYADVSYVHTGVGKNGFRSTPKVWEG